MTTDVSAVTAPASGADAGEEPRRPRRMTALGGPRHDVTRTLLALLASGLGVLPLCSLFTDAGWLIDVWLAMLVVVGPAAVLRRKYPASAGQIWIGVVLLVPWLTLNYVREHAVFGFVPLRGSWHDVGALMTDLHHTTTDEVAPVHTTVAIRLALCALLGLIAALVDLLAVVGRRGALAGIPLLVIYTISGAVPRAPVEPVWFAASAAAFLLLLALDSSDDVQRWGHYIPRSTRGGRRRAAGVVSAQRIAATAIIAAIVLPVFIPSNSRNFVANLFHPGGGNGSGGFGADSVNAGSGTGGIDPFAALRGQLNRDRKIDLMTVQVSSQEPGFAAKGKQPFYLRTNVLPVYTENGWHPGTQGELQSVNDTQYSSAPGTAFVPNVLRFTARITVTGLRSNPPVFASPTALDGVNTDTEWSTQNMLLLDSTISNGEVIQEDVAQPNPTVADLRGATESDPAMNDWLKLPTIAAYVRDLTARVTAKATTPYEKARAISDFFANPANGFFYSLQTSNGDTGDDLSDFLQKRAGYCQQFAAAMAVMLRLSGVPSRVVLGYAHDLPDATGSFTVSTYDAHAWVEAYFAGIGWIPFDPTPIAGISGGSANDLVWAQHGKTQGGSTSTNSDPRITTHPSASKGTSAPSTATAAPDSGISGLAVALLIVAAIVVGLLLIPAFVRWRRKRHRLRLARHGDTDALWAELSDTATDLGYVWSPARTPRQVATWLGTSSGSANGALATLTTAVERARYAPPGSIPPGDQLVRDLGAVEAGLRSTRTTGERLQAVFWPASLGWSRMRFIGSWLPGRRRSH